jgi:GNAT superfamily N-acetyltransferase
MYTYLNRVSELYFIEILENGKYRAIGDVAIKVENPPIAIGVAEYRHKGIGKLVMLAILERAKEIGFTQIKRSLVYEHNVVSQKLHESLGFKCVDQIGNELFYDLIF